MTTNRRRTTLGNISHSTNSKFRPSFGAGLSMNSGKQSSLRQSLGGSHLHQFATDENMNFNNAGMMKKGRASMLPSTNIHHQNTSTRKTSISTKHTSIGGKSKSISMSIHAAGSGLRQDPRPTQDKSYIKESTKTLVQFLIDHEYEYPLTQKMLQTPTSKDITQILTFLYRQIDPNFKFVGRFDEEVVNMFKSLKYPFQISKTALSAVGSPNAWPKLLACIMWFVELLMYDEIVQEEKTANAEDETIDTKTQAQKDDALFLDYLENAYSCFLSGDDDMYNTMEQELISKFQEKDLEIEKECEGVNNNIKALRDQIEACNNRRSTLPKIEQQSKDYATDLDNFKVYIAQLKAHKDENMKRINKRRAEIDATQDQLNRSREEITMLRRQVAHQDLSAEDVHRMQEERKRLREAMTKASEHKNTMYKNLYEGEMEYARKIEELETEVHMFNTKATELHLIPIEAKNSNGIKFEMQVNRSAIKPNVNPETVLGDVAVRGAVLTALIELKDLVTEGIHEYREQLFVLKENDNELEDKLEMVKIEISTLQKKYSSKESLYKAEKEKLEDTINDNLKELDDIEQEVFNIRRVELPDVNSQISKCKHKLDSYEKKLLAQREENEETSMTIASYIENILNLCADYKETVGQKVNNAAQILNQKKNDITNKGCEDVETGNELDSLKETSIKSPEVRVESTNAPVLSPPFDIDEETKKEKAPLITETDIELNHVIEEQI